jgi:hypothetical protein
MARVQADKAVYGPPARVVVVPRAGVSHTTTSSTPPAMSASKVVCLTVEHGARSKQSRRISSIPAAALRRTPGDGTDVAVGDCCTCSRRAFTTVPWWWRCEHHRKRRGRRCGGGGSAAVLGVPRRRDYFATGSSVQRRRRLSREKYPLCPRLFWKKDSK